MTTNVDVLAVMYAARWCPRMQPQIAQELGPARAAVADLIEKVHAAEQCGDWLGTAWGIPGPVWRELTAALARVEGRNR